MKKNTNQQTPKPAGAFIGGIPEIKTDGLPPTVGQVSILQVSVEAEHVLAVRSRD